MKLSVDGTSELLRIANTYFGVEMTRKFVDENIRAFSNETIMEANTGGLGDTCCRDVYGDELTRLFTKNFQSWPRYMDGDDVMEKFVKEYHEGIAATVDCIYTI